MMDQVKILKLSSRILQNHLKEEEGSFVSVYTQNTRGFSDCSQTQEFITKSYRRLLKTPINQQNQNHHSLSHQEHQTVMHDKPWGGMNPGMCGVVSPCLREVTAGWVWPTEGSWHYDSVQEAESDLSLKPHRLREVKVKMLAVTGEAGDQLQRWLNKTPQECQENPMGLSELWGMDLWETGVSSTLVKIQSIKKKKIQSINTVHYYNWRSITISAPAWWGWGNPGYV